MTFRSHPARHVLDGDLPIHKNANTHFLIALPEGNALREQYEYEYLDVSIYFDGRLDVRPRFRDDTASPHDKKRRTDWNYPHTRITDLSEIPIETRREIQQTWERYLDTLAKVRDLSILPDESYAPSAGKYEGLWVLENPVTGKRWAVGPQLGDNAAHEGQREVHTGRWVTVESNEFTSWTDTELEEFEGLDCDRLDEVASKYAMPAGNWVNINEA